MHLGRKENETRSWPTQYRGDVVICAAKRKMTKDDLDTLYILVDPPDVKNYVIPYGCALCVVELWKCIPTTVCPACELEWQLGDYSPGRFAWMTRNLRALKEPVPILGRQGLWTLTPEEEAAVRAQL